MRAGPANVRFPGEDKRRKVKMRGIKKASDTIQKRLKANCFLCHCNHITSLSIKYYQKCIWLWFEWMQSDAFLCDKHTIFSFPLFWVIWYISFLLTCSFNAFLEIFILTDPNNKLIRTVHWLEQFWFEIVYNFGRLKLLSILWNLVMHFEI